MVIKKKYFNKKQLFFFGFNKKKMFYVRLWLFNYLYCDGRLSQLSKYKIASFFSYFLFFQQQLRSSKLRSGSLVYSTKNFWFSRQFLNTHMKLGFFGGFKKC